MTGATPSSQIRRFRSLATGSAVLATTVLIPAVAGAAPPEPCTTSVCSFDVPDGQYEIRLWLGGSEAARTGINVEGRRVALAPVDTAAGRVAFRSVTVDVHTPESMPSGEEGPGTPGLQVYPTGDAPRIARIQVVARPHVPKLFIISDSTASDWGIGPKRGWGQALPQYFRAGIDVANYAQSGAGTDSYLTDPRYFPRVQPMITRGDPALIQLAHNDKQTPEDVYRANLARLVAGVRERGGAPVLVTPPVRHLFGVDGRLTPTGRVVNSLGVDLPAVMRDEARQLGVPLLDLTADSQALLESLGEDASWSLYLTVEHDGVKDSSHFSEHGSAVIAGLVARELAGAHLPAAHFLRHEGI